MTEPDTGNGFLATVEALNEVAEDLAGEFQLRAVLERILQRCTALMGCDAGSISRVDEANGTYRKEADIGIECQSGQVFPLAEGMTGEVVRRRRPVSFDRYEDVIGGHISAADRKTLKGVIGVPLEWQGRIIGVCVVFSRDADRRFGDEDATLLGLFARHAAVALANATMYEAVEARARLEAAAGERERLIEEVHELLTKDFVDLISDLDKALELLPGHDSVARTHMQEARFSAGETLSSLHRSLQRLREPWHDERTLEEIVRSELLWAEKSSRLSTSFVSIGTPVPLERTLVRDVCHVARGAIDNVIRHAAATSLRLGLGYDSASLTLLVQDDGRGFDVDTVSSGRGEGRLSIMHRVREAGGSFEIDSSVGWGTSLRAVFPYRRDARAASERLPVLVAASTEMTRAGLSRMLVWSEQTIEIVAESATTEAAMEALKLYHPLVSVVAYPREELLASIETMLTVDRDLAVVAVCPDGDPDLVAEALLAGARGCVLDGSDRSVLTNAVIAANRGQSIVPTNGAWERRVATPGAGLTAREREVRALLERGLSDKAIAARLVISTKTVEKHVGAVLRKTGARSRAELAARATRVER
ncbi:GAF domain-containing protein [Rhizomonospora bruguierae]|uniref:GAF domain-containing protein n=1 Tax=Rhizomonospora bruguierae TaxID=1581705 RepID=UPI001BCBB1DF|nr:GAF domain-containing protein [Micromonospora sp. NBRC 107566]